MSSSRSYVKRLERLADDESRNYHTLQDASKTRLQFLVLAIDWKAKDLSLYLYMIIISQIFVINLIH